MSRTDIEIDIITELKQQIVKEQLNHIDLSHIRKGFFSDVLKYRISCDNKILKIIDQMLSRLYDIRYRKLSMLFSCDNIRPFKDRLTDKEVECWEKCNSAIRLLKSTQYGVKPNE